MYKACTCGVHRNFPKYQKCPKRRENGPDWAKCKFHPLQMDNTTEGTRGIAQGTVLAQRWNACWMIHKLHGLRVQLASVKEYK